MTTEYIVNVYVRICETDLTGYANSTSFMIYFEEARSKFFNAIGYSPDKRDVGFILASTSCRFKGAAKFNQSLKIRSTVSRIGKKSFQLSHQMEDGESGIAIAEGEAVIVCFDFEKQETIPIPGALLSVLENHLVNA
ncbi:thioesterase family protein [Bacillus sp. V5-8f]|uniref:acyl-CoA thioesterase n=1 Tax=Bacillus sp. V5-8f TaxID=2053044 RepID=UPI000C793D5C|nr:acyl-CoA thioesterase [Bacillus sp. V5-8f]PLT35567.1 acyl-CoA thioesterase [Bacillus sp. V5-8f]